MTLLKEQNNIAWMKCKKIRNLWFFNEKLWFSLPLSICLMALFLDMYLQHGFHEDHIASCKHMFLALWFWFLYVCQRWRRWMEVCNFWGHIKIQKLKIVVITWKKKKKRNLRKVWGLVSVRIQHGSNDAKNIKLPWLLCFEIFFVRYSSSKYLMW